MKIINTRVHGLFDYSLGLLWMIAPWLFGFAAGGAETWMAVLTGSFTIFYSLMTDYELGLFDVLPMEGHLKAERIVGAVLVVSPWLFGFAGQVWIPHVVVGLLYIIIPAITIKPARKFSRLRTLLRSGSNRFSATTVAM